MHAFRGHGGSWGITLPITSSISLMSRTNMANSPPIISITNSAIIISPITSSAADGSEDTKKIHHDRGFFWAGPVFWPFAFGDIFSFAFWPYYDPFWDYGPDFIFASLFWPYGADDYAYYGPSYSFGDIYTGYRRHRRAYAATAESPIDIAEACSGVAPGLTGLPMDRIEKTLQPGAEQRASFDELKAASGKAEDIMKASCPSEMPLTPVNRLGSVEKRVDTMIQAVQALRAPLDTFYNSLTEEQKRRLDNLARRGGHNQAGKTIAQLCSNSAARFTNLPSEQIRSCSCNSNR